MLYLIAALAAYGLSVLGAVPFMVVFCLCLIVPIVTQFSCYYNHVSELEEIEECKANIVIYKEQADEILSEIKLHLIDKYPEHELKVFEMFTNNTADVLAVRYPELKTDTVFKKYIDSLIKYKNSIYNVKKTINKHRRTIATRARTIKLTALPILPKEKI